MIDAPKGGCAFCLIVRKETPLSIVYEDDFTFAFLDAKPINEGHTLVIPKKHYQTIFEMPDEEVARLFTIVRRTAIAVKNGVEASGIVIIQRNGRAAHQLVPHVHVHVIPQHTTQLMTSQMRLAGISRQRLDYIAGKIRSDSTRAKRKLELKFTRYSQDNS